MNTCMKCAHKNVCEWCIDDSDYDFPTCSDFLEERPQGEWNTHHVAFHLTCPFCGCNIRALKDMVFEGDYNYNYCPNCGADMRGGREWN